MLAQRLVESECANHSFNVDAQSRSTALAETKDCWTLSTLFSGLARTAILERDKGLILLIMNLRSHYVRNLFQTRTARKPEMLASGYSHSRAVWTNIASTAVTRLCGDAGNHSSDLVHRYVFEA